jgi:hypothetical protein
VVIWGVVRFLNEMRSGLRVDSKKFDIAFMPGSYGRGEDGSGLTWKRYNHFFTRGQNSETLVFKSWQR